MAPAFYAHVKARVCTRHYMEGDGSTGELNIKLLGGGDKLVTDILVLFPVCKCLSFFSMPSFNVITVLQSGYWKAS